MGSGSLCVLPKKQLTRPDDQVGKLQLIEIQCSGGRVGSAAKFPDLAGKGGVFIPPTARRIGTQQTVRAHTVVVPARMIGNGVKAHSLDPGPASACPIGFGHNVIEPGAATVTFGADLSQQERAVIACRDLYH